MNYSLSLIDYVGLIRRRFLIFFISTVIVGVIGTVVVFKIPSIYKAEGLVLVETQQIPADFIQSTITSAAEERIRLIQRRILVRNKLFEIAEKFDLYPEMREDSSVSAVTDKLRSSLDLDISSVGRSNPRGRGGQESVVFTIGFRHSSPEMSLRVTNEFVTLFLEENICTRTQRASDTTAFLTKELERLGGLLDEQEARISQFKSENSNALPEQLNMHFNMLERSKSEYNRTIDDIRAAQEELRFREIEVDALTNGRSTEDTANVFAPSRELSKLQARLAELRLQYLDAHPEVQSLLARIRSLQARIQELEASKDLAEEIAAAEVERDEIAQSEGLSSPRYQKLVEEIDDKRAALNRLEDVQQDGFDSSLALEEARLKFVVTSINKRIAALDENRARYEAEVKDLENRILLTPRVESELSALVRQNEETLQQYRSILRKKQEAELAENLEQDQKGERFVLIDPPVLPDKPFSPNRLKLMAMVLAAAGGFGAAVAFSRDLLLGTIQSPQQLGHLLGDLHVESIPTIETIASKRRLKKQLIAGAIAAPSLGIAALAMIHVFIRPVDIAFYRLLNKLDGLI